MELAELAVFITFGVSLEASFWLVEAIDFVGDSVTNSFWFVKVNFLGDSLKISFWLSMLIHFLGDFYLANLLKSIMYSFLR